MYFSCFLVNFANIFSQQKSVELLLPIIFLYSNCKYIPVDVYLFNVSNGGTRAICEICLKLKIKTSERRHWRFVNFEQVYVGWVTSLRLTDMICLTSNLYFQFWKNGICSLAIRELKKIHSLLFFPFQDIRKPENICHIFRGDKKGKSFFFGKNNLKSSVIDV